ncbi:hypothetical protein [Kitasatospora sp. NPDC088346]|uniref:hypothetical protein n=1 Tax=Kitasatospora sp. NPDC088346 TaxID=3364073 RepID=UPI00380E20AA
MKQCGAQSPALAPTQPGAPVPDFHFHDWTPADDASADAQDQFLKADWFYAHGTYDFLSRSVSRDSLDEYLIYADRGADWDYPGVNRILCAHIRLDPAERTFTIDKAGRPTFELGAAWLISRGADPAVFRSDVGTPRGPSTLQEAQLLEHLRLFGDRYHVVNHDTDTHQQYETWAILKDTTADPEDQSRLLLLEQWRWDERTCKRTVRLAEFDSYDAIAEWLEDRAVPLTTAQGRSTAVPESLVPITGALERLPTVARPGQIHAARIRTLPPGTGRSEALGPVHGHHAKPAGRSR